MLVQGQSFGGYRIDAWIGQGAQATVYRARHTSTERDVALKVFSSVRDRAANERFLREARAGAQFAHPRIVTVYDCGVQDGVPYIAMRLVRGPSLADVLAKTGPLPPDRALAVLADVAEALDAVHAGGMVHRDVKPGNVLLDFDDRANLSDFGIALTTDMPRLTQQGQFIGTIEYTAPEVIRGDDASRASDVYAFGILAYEVLTGRPPFVGRAMNEIAADHLGRRPPPAGSLRPGLPAALDAALATALAKSPAVRDIPAATVVEEIGRALEGWQPHPDHDDTHAEQTRLMRHWSGEATVAGAAPLGVGPGGAETRVLGRSADAAALDTGRRPSRRDGRGQGAGRAVRRRVLIATAALLLAGAGGAYGAWQYMDSRVERAETAQADSYRNGFTNGRAKGLAAGRDEGLSQGRAEGLEQGRAEGREAGIAEGRRQGRSEGVQQGRTVPGANPGDYRLVRANERGYSEYLGDPLPDTGGCFIISGDGDVRSLQTRGLFDPCNLLIG